MKNLLNNMRDRVNATIARAQLGVNALIEEERGDTNFISIAIILIVVLIIAAIFIGFGDQIGTRFKEAIDKIFGALDGMTNK